MGLTPEPVLCYISQQLWVAVNTHPQALNLAGGLKCVLCSFPPPWTMLCAFQPQSSLCHPNASYLPRLRSLLLRVAGSPLRPLPLSYRGPHCWPLPGPSHHRALKRPLIAWKCLANSGNASVLLTVSHNALPWPSAHLIHVC